MLLIKKNKFVDSKKYLIYIAFIVIIPLFFYWFYKNILEDLIYATSFNREKPNNILNYKRGLHILREMYLMYIIKLGKALIHSIRAVQFYNFIDYAMFIIVNTLYIMGIIKYKFVKIKKLNKFLLFSIVGFILSNVIFFVSTYVPTLYDFANRTMAVPKFFIGLILLSIIFLIVRKKPKIAKGLLIMGVLVLSISAISVKNAWIYANDFNNNLFSKTKSLIQSLPEKDKNIYRLAIDYDRDSVLINDKHFILKEPIYYASWETNMLAEFNHFNEIDSSEKLNRGGQFTGSQVFVKSVETDIPDSSAGSFIDMEEYPYYYVKPLENKIFVIRNKEDLLNAIKK